MAELCRGDLVQWIANARHSKTKEENALLFQGQVLGYADGMVHIAITRPANCHPSSAYLPLNRIEKVSD